MPEKTIRVLNHEITRRDAIKAGGIAGLGLAFAAPVVRSIKPQRAFAQGYGPACEAPSIVKLTSFSEVATYEVTDASGIAFFTVTGSSAGAENPDIVVMEDGVQLDFDDQGLPFTHDFINCPRTVSATISIAADENKDSEYTLTVTNCCGNTASVVTPVLNINT